MSRKTKKCRRGFTIYLGDADRVAVDHHRLTVQPQPKFTTYCAWLVMRGLAAEQGGK